jgi:hypothetical protein
LELLVPTRLGWVDSVAEWDRSYLDLDGFQVARGRPPA